MDILNLVPVVYTKFSVFFLAFSRISTFFSTFIIFRQDWVNTRIIISLSAVLSLYVLFYFPDITAQGDLMSLKMIIQVLFEIFYGFVAAFILNIVFEVFAGVGQIISMQIGLGMASLFDPKLGNITTLTHFYMFSIILIFFFLNGHLFVIQTLLDSFISIPLNQDILPFKLLLNILDYSKIIFVDSILLSITVLVAILLTNFALAIMSKFAPQFNVFSIGINLSLIIGLACVYITFNLFVNKSETILSDGMQFMRHSLTTVK